MDKIHRHVRRGTNRFTKKQSGLLAGFLGKVKKVGSFKKLGLAVRLNTSHEDHQREMVCEIEASTKKSKFPKRNSKGVNGLDHASVPRKLRSAMKNRSLESGSVSGHSSASKKVISQFKTRIESSKKECKAVTDPITKDEEEVAETLYALAGMFPETDHAGMTGKSDNACLDQDVKLETVKDAVINATDSLASIPSLAKISPSDEMPLRQSGSLDFLGGSETKPAIASAMIEHKSKPASIDTDYKNNVVSGSNALRGQPKTLKRCATHIHITRLIRVLKSTTSPLALHQNDQTPSKNWLLNFTAKGYSDVHFPDKPGNNNTKTAQETTELTAELYGPMDSQNPGYDFLSLSSTRTSRINNTIDDLNRSALFPFPNSIPQHQPLKTFSIPHPESRLISSTLASGVQRRSLPLSFVGSYQTGPASVSNQMLQQLQQQWAAARYTAVVGNSIPFNHYSVLQTSGNAPLHSASTRYYNVSQLQQPCLMVAAATTSLNHHSLRPMNTQQHHSPLVYEDTRPTPLQLL